MRRVQQQKHRPAETKDAAADEHAPAANANEYRNRKAQKKEQEEVETILREEGLLDESEGAKVRLHLALFHASGASQIIVG